MRASPAPQAALATAFFFVGFAGAGVLGAGFEVVAAGEGAADSEIVGATPEVVTAGAAACGSTPRFAYATPPATNGTTATAAATATTRILFIDGD
jgi:hypothetical protein